MRIFYATVVIVVALCGDLLLYGGRHIGGAAYIAERFAQDVNQQVRYTLGRLRI